MVKPGVLMPADVPTKQYSPNGSSTRKIGDGWTTVVVTDGTAGLGVGSPRALSTLMDAFTQVSGGRLLSTALVSVLLTNDGKMYIGAVTPAALQQVAKTGRPL
jgi:hypothetical protein